MVELRCNHCKSTFYLNNVDKYKGSLVIFECKNCGKRSSSDISTFQNESTIIQDVDNSNTEIVESSIQYQIAKILILDSERKHYLTEGKYTVGRISELKPSIIEISNDTFISRQHFIIIGKAVSKTKIEYSVKDNDSKNGTWVNGIRLKSSEEIYLQHKDQLRAGNTSFEIIFEKLNIPL